MFSALQQGSQIYILEKKNEPKLTIGEVVSVTAPDMPYSAFGLNNFYNKVNISAKVDDQVVDYKQLGSNLSIASDPNTGTVITETRELMMQEVENMVLASKRFIENVPYHEKVIKAGELIVKKLDPRLAKEQERDEDIFNLKAKVGGMETKLDKIFDLLTKPETSKD